MSSDNVSFTLTHHGDRGWEQRWRQVLQGHRKLSAIYDGTTRLDSADEWEALVVGFFIGCHHMADWFRNDGALPQVVRSDAFPHLHADADLRLAAAISHTSKHLERSDPNAITAYVLDVSGGTHGGAVTVAWETQGRLEGTRDARALGNACLASWRAFLDKHGLAEPGSLP